MKLIEKRNRGLLMLAAVSLTILYAACTKSDPIAPLVLQDDQTATPMDNEVGIPQPDYKFLRTLAYVDEDGSKRSIFTYENDALVREDFIFVGLNAWSSQFEYNAQNRLEVQSLCSAEDITKVNGTDFECNQIFELRSYSYNNDKLGQYSSEKFDESGIVIFNESVTINLDDRGNIISELYNNSPNSSQNHSYIYTDQDNIRKKRVVYLPTNTTEEFTYEVDDGINPFYPLWQAFGYYRKPASDQTLLSPMFTPHNVTKVFVDNVLKLEVDYTYDPKGYPLLATFKRHINSGSFREGTISYTYSN